MAVRRPQTKVKPRVKRLLSDLMPSADTVGAVVADVLGLLILVGLLVLGLSLGPQAGVWQW